MKLNTKKIILILLALILVFSIWSLLKRDPAPVEPQPGSQTIEVPITIVPSQTTESAVLQEQQEPENPQAPPAEVAGELPIVSPAAADSPQTSGPEAGPPQDTGSEQTLPEDGRYDSKEEVALYIHLYGHLPSNYITKKQAEDLHWDGGTLEKIAPGCSIGGDRFGNYQHLLPEKKGRYYTECDIDTVGKKKRGAKRIIFSNDGLIYYTDDHYESFELLYGEE